MRRHSTVSETPSPHSRITRQSLPTPTTNDHRVDQWPGNGYRRPCKGRKLSKKDEMAASVLPASNAYNDFRVKYHSVSGGSALSQSMKYAEAWLYGSLSVRTNGSRPALFDYDGRQRGGAAPVCWCAPEPSSGGPPASSALSGYSTVGRRGTPPSKGCGATDRPQPLTDPYDAVRRSRLAGAVPSQRLARAKSHSPSGRQESDRRKSILDCDLSAYDLLRQTGSSEATGYTTFSDEDERRIATTAVVNGAAAAASEGKRKKRQRRLTFHKSKTKLKEAGEKLSNALSPSSKKNDEKETNFVDDVSIAGQKIRIFNGFDRTHRDVDGPTDDWISDSNDEIGASGDPELEDVEVTLAEDDSDEIIGEDTIGKDLVDTHPRIDYGFPDRGKNWRESTPPKPPRRRCFPSGECEPNVAIVVVGPAGTAATARIKSILKKSCAADEPTTITRHRTVVDVTTCTSPTVAAEVAAVDSPSSCGGHLSDGRRRHLVSACHRQPDQLRRKMKTAVGGGKIKKQVQFKGMRGEMGGWGGGSGDTDDDEGAASTTAAPEDESGSRLTNGADASAAAAAETGYAIDRSITRKAVDALGGLCDSRRSRRLECDVRGECSAFTGRRSPASSVDSRPSPTQSTAQSELQRASATTPSPPSQSNLLVASPSRQTSAAPIPATEFGRHTRRAINSTSLRKLQRTLSECVSTRPLLVGLHRKSFTDTMRLQIRANTRPADARALFSSHHQRPRDAPVQPFSPARAFCLQLPDVSPLRVTLGTISVPASLSTFETSASSFSSDVSAEPSHPLPAEHDRRIFIGVGGDGLDANTARIPSLTRTFLQNRLRPNHPSAVASSATKSAIKINVCSPPISGIASTAENCTIVTISSGTSVPRSRSLQSDQQLAPSTRRKNNSIVLVNVAVDQPLYQNGERAEAVAAVDSSTSASSYAATEDGDLEEDGSSQADFSLHYMSCAIDGRLTEQEVGLQPTPPSQDEVAGGVEPIYEEISEVAAPPLPSRPPPDKVEDGGIVIPPRSIFEGASKYDILTYLAGAKERCRIPTSETPHFVIDEGDADAEAEAEVEAEAEASGVPEADLDEPSQNVGADIALRLPPRSFCGGGGGDLADFSRRISHLSSVSDSSDELACFLASVAANSSEKRARKNSAEIERNDSGVGSETSQCSRSKWQQIRANSLQDQQLVCEDCDLVIESNNSENGSIFAPLVCRKCSKRRVERREIITEIVETEEKYGRDLRIILDEFYKPMLVAGLLSPEQLSSVFLNVRELLEHNTTLAEKLRDGYEIAVEQGDEDLLTFDVGHIFLDATPMLHAFESYCTRQGNAALLLANLEREKELLKIFLRVSQMENTVLRRMNLNSFLMVPVQRVTKYPLLLARLYKVTPEHHVVQRELLKEARHNIELHLEHINSVTKDIGSTKIWRKISMINGRRGNGDIDDIVSLKLQKIAVEVLEWGHDEVRFAMEGRLLYAQCTDCNWKRSGRTVKVVPINALLVTLGKPTENYNPELDDLLTFPPKNGIREASLLLMKEKSGKYSLVREPLLLENCIIYCDGDYEEYFEVQEIHSKETYIFKGEDGERTKRWFRQLQYHCQGLGCWRKRRNALANIMINSMKTRN